jgi:hypothetical protein
MILEDSQVFGAMELNCETKGDFQFRELEPSDQTKSTETARTSDSVTGLQEQDRDGKMSVLCPTN